MIVTVIESGEMPRRRRFGWVAERIIARLLPVSDKLASATVVAAPTSLLLNVAVPPVSVTESVPSTPASVLLLIVALSVPS